LADREERAAASRGPARVGVIGTGWWATYAHLPALVARPDVRVVALANRGAEKLRLAADAYRVARTYTDVAAMLEREALDGVVVAVPQAAHYEVAKAALERGCHILLEKPMVLRSDEARDLVELARRRQREIVMGYPWHYTAHVHRAREAVLGGELGEVQLVASLFASTAYETYRGNLDAYAGVMEAPVVRPAADINTELARGGGQAYCQVTHSAALAFWVTGLRAARVSAQVSCLDAAVDVVDAVSARLSNGAAATLASTGNLRPGDPGQHALAIYCGRGYVELDLIAGTLRIRRHDGATDSPAPLPEEERYPRFAPANNLVDVILGRSENRSPGEIGRTTVEFLAAVHESAARQGQPVGVPG
jgi:predicted dehydrogenase